MIFNKDLDDISEADLDALIENGVRESRRLDYKRELPGRNDAAKKEFLADISSFANSDGGDLVYGIDEQREDGQPTGLPVLVGLEEKSLGAEILRLEGLATDGIDPRIPGLRSREIPCRAGRVLVFRVPKSPLRPHMVSFQKSSRFFSRTSGGKYQMDASEIRQAFTRRLQGEQQLREFQKSHASRLIHDGPRFPMVGSSMLVIQVVPSLAFDFDAGLELRRISEFMVDLRPASGWGYDGRYSGAGYSVISSEEPRSETLLSYTHIYRNGIVEMVDAWAPRASDGLINALALEKTSVDFVERIVSLLPRLGCPGPFSVLLSFLGFQGLGFRETGWWRQAQKPVTVDPILLDPLTVEGSDDDVAALLRSAFDVLWQHVGRPGAPSSVG